MGTSLFSDQLASPNNYRFPFNITAEAAWAGWGRVVGGVPMVGGGGGSDSYASCISSRQRPEVCAIIRRDLDLIASFRW